LQKKEKEIEVEFQNRRMRMEEVGPEKMRVKVFIGSGTEKMT